jgi:D-galactarolactone isomerase
MRAVVYDLGHPIADPDRGRPSKALEQQGKRMPDSYNVTGGGKKPKLICPPKACETHSHVYGPPEKYKRFPGRTPDYGASVEQYAALLDRLGMERGVIVQPSLYSWDNTCSLDAMAWLGKSRARGVAVTKTDVSKEELQRLHDAGMRGIRFFLLVDDFTMDDAEAMAKKVAPFGWHLQAQGRDEWMEEAMPILQKLPVDVVIDHVGRTPPEGGVDHPHFQALLRFMETGRCWVKISAPYLATTDGPPAYADVGEKVKKLVEVRPDRLVWAANWPHPGHTGPHDKPEEADLLDLMLDWVPDEKIRNAILADNPGKLYDFDD